MNQVAVIGTGGHSRVMTNILKLNGYNIVGYYDDYNEKDLNLLGRTDELDESIPNYVCGIGDIKTRRQIIEFQSDKNIRWMNVIHSFTSLAPDLRMGVGNAICAGVIIQPNVLIGDHCIINTGTSIDHDCRIGSFVHLAPRTTLCGTVEIGDFTFIGAGTTIINNIRIGSNVIIGAGSNVVCDIPSNSVAYGNPCRVIRDN